MKILIDGYWWHEGPHSNRLVTLEIVKRWVADFPDDELLLAVPTRQQFSDTPAPPVPANIVSTRLRIHPAINLVELPVIAHRHKVDAILSFNFAAPSNRSAVLLHDVLFQSRPEWFTPLERVYFSAMLPLARRAGSVIATSRTERDRIARLNPRLRRIVNCGLAVSTSLTDAAPNRPAELSVAADSFILCVGRLNVRKNLEDTIRGALESGRLSEDFPLVVVGEPSGRVANISEFARAISDKSVIFVESVTDGALKWLYQNCRLFVCLSLDEGFGLPVIEAASLGAPVVLSDIPVFRETLGSYGTFVNPVDLNAISESIRIAVTHRSSSNTTYTEQYSWRSVCACIRTELQRL